MRNLYKTELKKAILNKYFAICLLICSGICIYSAISSISGYFRDLNYSETFSSLYGYTENPALACSSLFNNWVGADWNAFTSSLLFLLMPLIASIPYSWSFASEKKSGYLNNIFTRVKRITYLKAKLFATFTTGFLCLFIPIVLNIMTVSSFIPAAKPNVFWDIHYNAPVTSVFSEMFYETPVFFIIFKTVLISFFGGCYSITGLATGSIIRNKFVAVSFPFVFALLFNYISNVFLPPTFEISPIQFLYGGGNQPSSSLMIVFEITVMLLFSFIALKYRGEKIDAL